MAYSILPIAGVNLVGTTPISFTYVNGSTTVSIPAFGPLGTEVFGSDGLRYVFAQAGATITASTATVAINTTTFAAAATGGTYLSPAVDLASGDYAWFSKASV